MKVRVVYRLDGSVAVIHPAPQSKAPDETEAEWLDRVFAKAMEGPLKDLPFDDMEADTLPDRRDRDAWEGKKGEGIKVNQAKTAALRAEKGKAQKIDAEIRRMAEENLKTRGEL